ncbi:MAG TPA: glutathione S-transferase N-terminal domain-containing protein [Steroidobacteraceae bacterium]|nr:glutathione S-transferase N-terminal domain-containing protein [Steroidobacteraceae bacterium]
MTDKTMKLYESAGSPNSRRVRIFLTEKGLSIPSGERLHLALRWNRPYPYLRLLPVRWHSYLSSNETPSEFPAAQQRMIME